MIGAIALRNLIKHARRSLVTIAAIAVGGIAMLLFGAFVTSVYFGTQTNMIQEMGQLQIYKRDFLQFGAADPDNYTLEDYSAIIKLVQQDPLLWQKISLISPQIQLAGIAGVVTTDNSKTFIGRGVIPSDIDTMRHWDGWNLQAMTTQASGLTDDDYQGAVVGIGMARMLGLCQALQIADCQDPPTQHINVDQSAEHNEESFQTLSFDGLVTDEFTAKEQRSEPQVNLLAATSQGAPNIESVFIKQAQAQSQRSLDNSFILLHFELARTLLYGEQPQATLLMIQLYNPTQVDWVQARMTTLFAEHGLALDVMKFNQVDPSFDRVFTMFSFIFGVVSLFLAIVIIFTIINTINLTIMERISEIGTIRALGFRRSFVVRLFLTESGLIGMLGVVCAFIGATVIAAMINFKGIQWTPPSNASPVTIRLMLFETPQLLLVTMSVLLLLSLLAAIYPTIKASRMNIISSLHHH